MDNRQMLTDRMVACVPMVTIERLAAEADMSREWVGKMLAGKEAGSRRAWQRLNLAMARLEHAGEERRQLRVETSIVTAPDGKAGILLQLPEGWTVIPNAADARLIARHLLELADELEAR